VKFGFYFVKIKFRASLKNTKNVCKGILMLKCILSGEIMKICLKEIVANL